MANRDLARPNASENPLQRTLFLGSSIPVGQSLPRVGKHLGALRLRPPCLDGVRNVACSGARAIDQQRRAATVRHPPAELLLHPVRLAKVDHRRRRADHQERSRAFEGGLVDLCPVLDRRRGLVEVDLQRGLDVVALGNEGQGAFVEVLGEPPSRGLPVVLPVADEDGPGWSARTRRGCALRPAGRGIGRVSHHGCRDRRRCAAGDPSVAVFEARAGAGTWQPGRPTLCRRPGTLASSDVLISSTIFSMYRVFRFASLSSDSKTTPSNEIPSPPAWQYWHRTSSANENSRIR